MKLSRRSLLAGVLSLPLLGLFGNPSVEIWDKGVEPDRELLDRLKAMNCWGIISTPIVTTSLFFYDGSMSTSTDTNWTSV